METVLSILASVISGIVLAALLGIWRILHSFVKEQREQNEAQRQFRRAQQRAEIMRYFRLVVENGEPITIEEMEHLDACYQAYHSNGGNGVGTLMHERIKQHARIVTQFHDDDAAIGGTE